MSQNVQTAITVFNDGGPMASIGDFADDLAAGQHPTMFFVPGLTAEPWWNDKAQTVFRKQTRWSSNAILHELETLRRLSSPKLQAGPGTFSSRGYHLSLVRILNLAAIPMWRCGGRLGDIPSF